MLIKNAQVNGEYIAHVRLTGNRVAEISASLLARVDEPYIDAAGGLLLPGLHDHHIHLTALAVARQSVVCGPPVVTNLEELHAAINHAEPDSGDWLRGISYHESVAGELNKDELDKLRPHTPLRIQHRSGRLWMFNSAGVEVIQSSGVQLPDRQSAFLESGRLFDQDDWLRGVLGKGAPPSLSTVAQLLNAYGVTGITDTTPSNCPDDWARFEQAQTSGDLRLRMRVMGAMSLGSCLDNARIEKGEFKIHLSDSNLPDFDQYVQWITDAHAASRNIAVHCVTQAELVLTLAAIEEAGAKTGDRIEHGSVIAEELLDKIMQLGLCVVTQPNFVSERGDTYRQEIDASIHQDLYRIASIEDSGIGLAFGTDAPFGDCNPWRAMQAATDRLTAAGHVLSATEAVSAKRALSGFLTPLDNPSSQPRSVKVGAVADLCLLSQSWGELQNDLAAADVAHTWFDGELVYSA